MRILFLGNFGVSYSTESHHAKTFESLGHEVIRLQEGKVKFEDIVPYAGKVDMFYWTHTHGWYTPKMDMALRVFQQAGIPSVGYHLDLWKGLKREADIKKDHYWNIEYFFTVDKQFVPDLLEMGIKGYYLPPGVFKDECYIAEPNRERFPYEVVFTGSRGYHDEWPYRPKLIDFLKETYGDRFGHYGGDGLGTIRGHDLNVLYSSAKVVVGDTLCINYNYPHYFSDRLFEVPGRGGFMIFPWIKGINNMFEETEMRTYHFNDFTSLKHYIDYYLENDSEREEIREAAHKRVLKDHTYHNRINYIINTVMND